MLTLNLQAMDPTKVKGIYTVRGVANRMPDRCLYLSPEAAAGFDAIAPHVVVTDMMRTPESSLEAEQRKVGVQPPGFSGHGLPANCIDIDVDKTMRLNRWNKSQLDNFMASHGWQCFRLDAMRGSEDWHYGFGVAAWMRPGESNTARAQERLMQSIYGLALKPDPTEVQRMLTKLHMYHGELDGVLGPVSRQAIGAFQRAWLCERTFHSKARDLGCYNNYSEGIADAVTARMLAFVSAEHNIKPVAA